MVYFSGFCAWVKEPLSQRALKNAGLTDLIQPAWIASGKVQRQNLPATKSMGTANCTSDAGDCLKVTHRHFTD
jgi:hypothetical protein|tara:strand:- start:356 stop:574 length:219 start_codon:yes stop_codon:yes gene_type:complete